MISLKLTRLIEQHSSELTDELVKKLHSSSRTRGPAAALLAFSQQELSSVLFTL